MIKSHLKLEFGIKEWGILVYRGMLHAFLSRVLGIPVLGRANGLEPSQRTWLVSVKDAWM